MPGEGAAAIALTRGAAYSKATNGWASLLGAATAEEPITSTSRGVCIGAGLTEAAWGAIEQARLHRSGALSAITVDLNGEPYRADQFGFTAARIAQALTPHWQRSVPALASGDLNATSALSHVALAAYAIHKHQQAGQHLVLASSDDTLRAAAVIAPLGRTTELEEIRAWRSPSM